MSKQTPRCPECGQPADRSVNNPARPFCSTRCKLIDLGDWIDERNAIPAEENPAWPSGDESPS